MPMKMQCVQKKYKLQQSELNGLKKMK